MAVRCLGMFCGAYEMYQNTSICYKAYRNIHTSVKYIIPKTFRQNNKILWNMDTNREQRSSKGKALWLIKHPHNWTGSL